jgi:hypothetical protein
MNRQGFVTVDAHAHFPWPGQWGRRGSGTKPELAQYAQERN